jgi:mono/diheme cytochrome c family protein
MVRYSADGGNETIIARGLRNSAGFDWSPIDGRIYATDNGRDMLGDDFPPCELNKIEEGGHFGWPYANGDKVPDPDFGEGNETIIRDSISPVFGFSAHNAPLGIEFVRSKKFPEEYWGAAIVALHGSWNRSEKDGYKVVSLHWDESGNVTEKEFVSGLLFDGEAFGRPSDVTEGRDGAFYISDDFADVIYRVAFGEEQAGFEVKLAKKFSAKETLATLNEQNPGDLSRQGLQLYKQFQCVGCHQDDAPELKTLEGLGAKYDLETLSATLEKPKAPMPLFPMNDAQRRAVSVYLIERYPGR